MTSEAPGTAPVRIDQRDDLLHVTLADPDRANALSGPMIAQLTEIYERDLLAAGVRAVLLTGSQAPAERRAAAWALAGLGLVLVLALAKTEAEVRAALDGRFSPLAARAASFGRADAASRGPVGLFNVESPSELARIAADTRKYEDAVTFARNARLLRWLAASAYGIAGSAMPATRSTTPTRRRWRRPRRNGGRRTVIDHDVEIGRASCRERV